MKEKFESLVDQLVGGGFFLEEAVELLEKTLIGRALEKSHGNQSAAAKQLGIHRNTLQRKIAQYELKGAKPRRKPALREARRTARRKTG
jgi:Fis family transcriptional regulator, factor for inversion stimulation protein